MKNIFKSKHATYLGVALTVSLIATEAFAVPGSTAGTDHLAPLLDKILSALSGTLGKVIMGAGLGLSGMAAVGGMNKTIIFTPIGIGLLLGNAKTLVNWIFG